MADDRVCEGYHVIKSKRIKDVEIVLAHNPKAPSPYVTWKSYAHRQFKEFAYHQLPTAGFFLCQTV